MISATGHRFNTLGATAMVLDCTDGLSVQSRFQVAPKNAGLKNSIISVGEVTDKGNEVVFRNNGGSIINLTSGRRIDFPRRDGVYKLNASMRLPAAPDYELEVMPLTIDEQEERLMELDEPRAVVRSPHTS